MKKAFVLLVLFVLFPLSIWMLAVSCRFEMARQCLKTDIRRAECKLGQNVSQRVLDEVAVHLRKDDKKAKAIEYGRIREATDSIYGIYRPEGEWKSPYETVQRAVNLHGDCVIGDASYLRKFEAYADARKKDQAFAKSLEMEKLLGELQNLWWRVHDVDSWNDLEAFRKEFQEVKKNLLQLLGEPDTDDTIRPATVYLPTEEVKPQRAPEKVSYGIRHMC